uniref:Uncharacterized protein n=1 Tax=Timema poppense TaxID=170557 RepID=A0A7R9H924_TIMPO|nr:unnamed protein product [Timema poppensis]
MGSSPGGVPRLDGHGVQVDEPHQRVLVHGVHVGQVCDAIVQHGGVSRYWTGYEDAVLDLFQQLLVGCALHYQFLTFVLQHSNVLQHKRNIVSSARGTHLSLATTIPSSWSSSPSMVRAKLTMVTLLNTSGKKWGLRSLEIGLASGDYILTLLSLTARQLPELFAVLLTDSAAYMLKAGASLKVIQTFYEEDAVSIREAKFATSYSSVVSDWVHVKSYSGNLPGVIVSLEARDLPLIESVKIMNTIQEGVKQTPGPVASSDATKLEQALQRNPGWRTMVASLIYLLDMSTMIALSVENWSLGSPVIFQLWILISEPRTLLKLYTLEQGILLSPCELVSNKIHFFLQIFLTLVGLGQLVLQLRQLSLKVSNLGPLFVEKSHSGIVLLLRQLQLGLLGSHFLDTSQTVVSAV